MDVVVDVSSGSAVDDDGGSGRRLKKRGEQSARLG